MGEVVAINSVCYNPARPWQFCVGGEDEYVRVYDERMVLQSAAAPGRADVLQPQVNKQNKLERSPHVTVRQHARELDRIRSNTERILYEIKCNEARTTAFRL